MHRKFLLAALITAVLGLLSSAHVVSSGADHACIGWPGCDSLSAATGIAVGAGKIGAMYLHRAVPVLGFLLLSAAWSIGAPRWHSGLAMVAALGQIVLAALAPHYHYHPLLHVVDQLLALAGMAWTYRAWLPAAAGPTRCGMARILVCFGLAWLAVQIVVGAWMAATHSGIACPEIPTCLGYWWPDADYAQGFSIWRGLSEGHFVAMQLAERIAVNWMHRVSGVGLAVWLIVIGIGLSAGRYGKAVSRTGAIVNILAFVQLISAILTVRYHAPVTAVLVHTALAAGLWMHMLRAAYLLGQPPVEMPEILPTEEVRTESAVPAEAEAPPMEERQVAPVEAAPTPQSLLQRLRQGLRKTGGGLAGWLAGLSRTKIDDELLEEIETILLMADVGVEATQALVKTVSGHYPQDAPVDADGMRRVLKQQMLEMLEPCNRPLSIDAARRPFVVLVVGVNGVGKTTTIGKLARRYRNAGHSVMLAAGDTFRAAAMEQLQTWGERNDIPVVAQHSGADSASVIFDAMQSAQAKGVDVLIADTAGRLHTKSNLMEELKKIKRILGRLDDSAPHEVLLVLDAGTGQNAVVQARQFHEAVALTGIAVTKLDGTAKGGVIFALARQFGIPIRYVGVGEGIDDLQDFHAETFVDALLGQETT